MADEQKVQASAIYVANPRVPISNDVQILGPMYDSWQTLSKLYSGGGGSPTVDIKGVFNDNLKEIGDKSINVYPEEVQPGIIREAMPNDAFSWVVKYIQPVVQFLEESFPYLTGAERTMHSADYYINLANDNHPINGKEFMYYVKNKLENEAEEKSFYEKFNSDKTEDLATA
ncbi:MAG: hypothetical protein PHU12_01025 [Candidatus Aenigmarchaeota archaeon]|nr:hypothetical protein [Candidatus Aenigmarchaeota archaeon]